jgi:hypothetical protein
MSQYYLPPYLQGMPYEEALAILEEELKVAERDVKRFEIPSHMVRNNPAASEDEYRSWNKRNTVVYHILNVQKLIDNAKALDK